MIIEKLEAEYPDLYDVVLCLFKAVKSETIIEIEYFRKSNLDIDYFQKVKDNDPMFHSKIKMPCYWKKGNRIDINWHFGGIRHWLNTIIYKLCGKGNKN